MESQTPIAVPAARPRAARQALPALSYVGVLILLGLVAIAPGLIHPGPVRGLPDDADVRDAQALLRGRVALNAGPLRWRSALLGESGIEALPAAASAASAGEPDLRRAAALLERAHARKPLDARITAACASLDLARGDLSQAERRYQAAIDQGGRYAEARLGLGLALALQADGEREPTVRRGLLLRAIGQFAAVPADAPAYLPALYNRALLLTHVGRSDEAHACAREYFARDPDGPWSQRLARAVARG